MWNAVVDVGLPRTGTYSFILAAQKAGLKAHHAYVQTVEELGARWYGGVAPAALVAYAALADSPFFLLDVNRTRRAHPGLSFVCTTRRRSAWLRSMIASRFAGGAALARRAAELARRPAPYPWRHESKEALGAYFDHHRDASCGGLPQIAVDADDRSKWRALCSAVPPAAARGCEAAAAASAWPTSHALVRKWEQQARDDPGFRATLRNRSARLGWGLEWR